MCDSSNKIMSDNMTTKTVFVCTVNGANHPKSSIELSYVMAICNSNSILQ